MLRRQKRKKLVYMPGVNHRYHAGYLKAREIFENGGIGKIHFIRARYGFGGRPGYGKEWRFKKAIAGGGELFDQGIHMIDMAHWFLGDFKDVMGLSRTCSGEATSKTTASRYCALQKARLPRSTSAGPTGSGCTRSRSTVTRAIWRSMGWISAIADRSS